MASNWGEEYLTRSDPWKEIHRQRQEEWEQQQRNRYEALYQQMIQQQQANKPPPRKPAEIIADTAYLTEKGLTLESEAHYLRIHVQGELLKRLVTLVRMAELAELVTPDEPKP